MFKNPLGWNKILSGRLPADKADDLVLVSCGPNPRASTDLVLVPCGQARDFLEILDYFRAWPKGRSCSFYAQGMPLWEDIRQDLWARSLEKGLACEWTAGRFSLERPVVQISSYAHHPDCQPEKWIFTTFKIYDAEKRDYLHVQHSQCEGLNMCSLLECYHASDDQPRNVRFPFNLFTKRADVPLRVDAFLKGRRPEEFSATGGFTL